MAMHGIACWRLDTPQYAGSLSAERIGLAASAWLLMKRRTARH